MKKLCALCVTLSLLVGLTACGSPAPATTTPPPAPTPSVVAPTPSTPAPTVPAPTPTPAASGGSGIPGSYYSDTIVGMELFGLTEHSYGAAPEEMAEYFAHSASARYDNVEIDTTFDYSMIIDNNHQIISATYAASWYALQDNSIFTSAAEMYLEFAASLAYDTADSEAAKAWVVTNMATVVQGENVSTTIGDATFELAVSRKEDGTPLAFILMVSAPVEE